MTASVNSFASSKCGDEKEDGKVDLTKLEKVEALTNLQFKIKNENVKLSNLTVSGDNSGSNFSCKKDDFQKETYSVTLVLSKDVDVDDDVVVYVGKISTSDDGKELKLDPVSNFKTLDAGSYVIISVTDKKKNIKVEKKVFNKKQKAKENDKGFEDDKGKDK